MRPYSSKSQAIEAFADHVSSAKAAFWQQLNMDFVMGNRDGCWMWDVEGEKKLFNLHTNGGVFNLGHRNPQISRALTEAVSEVDIGNGHLISWARAALAEKIAASMPADLTYTVFGVSGGEAVDLAIRVARAHTGKDSHIIVEGGYHGVFDAVLWYAEIEEWDPATGDPPIEAGSEGIPRVLKKLTHFTPLNDANYLEDLLKRHHQDIGAFLIEPIMGNACSIMASQEYVRAARELCEKYNVVMIVDEVKTGIIHTNHQCYNTINSNSCSNSNNGYYNNLICKRLIHYGT